MYTGCSVLPFKTANFCEVYSFAPDLNLAIGDPLRGHLFLTSGVWKAFAMTSSVTYVKTSDTYSSAM